MFPPSVWLHFLKKHIVLYRYGLAIFSVTFDYQRYFMLDYNLLISSKGAAYLLSCYVRSCLDISGGREIGTLEFRLGSCSLVIHIQATFTCWLRTWGGHLYGRTKYEVLFRGWKIREDLERSMGGHRYKDMRRNVVREWKVMGQEEEKQKAGVGGQEEGGMMVFCLS